MLKVYKNNMLKVYKNNMLKVYNNIYVKCLQHATVTGYFVHLLSRPNNNRPKWQRPVTDSSETWSIYSTNLGLSLIFQIPSC